MVLTTQGKNFIRDLIDADISQGQLGTDNTAPNATDTGLISPVAATLKTVTTTTADKQINIEYSLATTDGNGNTYQEFETRVTLGGINRVTFVGIPKTSTIEMNVITTLFIK